MYKNTMLSVHNTQQYQLNIKSESCNIEPYYSFMCFNITTGKCYFKTYHWDEITKQYPIFKIFSNMLNRLLKEQIPHVEFINNTACLKWLLDVPYVNRIEIVFTINNYDPFITEELKSENAQLIEKVKQLEKRCELLTDTSDTKDSMTDAPHNQASFLVSPFCQCKSIGSKVRQRAPDVVIHTPHEGEVLLLLFETKVFVTHPSLIKQFVKYDILTHIEMHNTVLNILKSAHTEN